VELSCSRNAHAQKVLVRRAYSRVRHMPSFFLSASGRGEWVNDRQWRRPFSPTSLVIEQLVVIGGVTEQ
jgi:hypothetical protein